MAVYERSFEPYAGTLTSPYGRFLVVARYALSDLFKSKLFVVFLTLCYMAPLIGLLLVYLRHNADLLESLGAMGIVFDEWVPIDERFFGTILRIQGTLAFFLVLFSGPRLVSRDLANNGLALYLCRPFSKKQYVAGKLAVLALLVSMVTWVPCLALWAVQTGLQGGGWGLENLRSAVAIVLSSVVWIAVLGFLSLAVSAWVKWRPVAGFLLLLIFFGGSLFAKVVEVLFHSEWGYVFDLHFNIRAVWAQLFNTTLPFFFRTPTGLSPNAPWLALAALVGLSLWALSRRIRAYEVVR